MDDENLMMNGGQPIANNACKMLNRKSILLQK